MKNLKYFDYLYVCKLFATVASSGGFRGEAQGPCQFFIDNFFYVTTSII